MGLNLALSLLLCDSKPLSMFGSQFPCQRQEQVSPSKSRAPAVRLPPHFLFTAASSSSFYPKAITITMATRLRLFQQVGKT